MQLFLIRHAPTDETGRTCLHLYSHHEEVQAVVWLLEHGASLEARQNDGRTPLHRATIHRWQPGSPADRIGGKPCAAPRDGVRS